MLGTTLPLPFENMAGPEVVRALGEGESDSVSSESPTPQDVTMVDRGDVRRGSRRTAAALSSHYGLRRPTTRNAKLFWYLPRSRWSALLIEAQDVSTQDQALVTLHKHSMAGRIMETKAGIAPPQPCATCVQASVECMVHAKLGGPCAYCRVTVHPDCTCREAVLASQGNAVRPEGYSIHARLTDLEQQCQQQQESIDRQTDAIGQLTTASARLSAEHQALHASCEGLGARLTAVELAIPTASLNLGSPNIG